MKNLKIYEEFKINLRSKITYLGDIIRDDYMHPDAKLSSKEYKEIINMGIDIIPLLIEDLKNKKYYSWVSALRELTNETPSKGVKGTSNIVKSWINWYDNQYEEWLKNIKNSENTEI